MERVSSLDIVNCQPEVELSNEEKEYNEAWEKSERVLRGMVEYIQKEGLLGYDNYRIQDTSMHGGICSVGCKSSRREILIVKYKDNGKLFSEKSKGKEKIKTENLPKRCEDSLKELLRCISSQWSNVHKVDIDWNEWVLLIQLENGVQWVSTFTGDFFVQTLKRRNTKSE